MSAATIVDTLWAWTPYLMAGFWWNIAVSLAAMGIGTAFGIGLALLRDSAARPFVRGAGAVTVMLHGAPTFVMLFYLTYLVPQQVTLLGIDLTIPLWLKASLALSVAVTAIISDIALEAKRHLKEGRIVEALLFVPAWTNYLLIIVMASSTASVIGVPEVVYRAKVIVGAVDHPPFAVWVYFYAMTGFLAFSLVVTQFMRTLRYRITHMHDRDRERANDTGESP